MVPFSFPNHIKSAPPHLRLQYEMMLVMLQAQQTLLIEHQSTVASWSNGTPYQAKGRAKGHNSYGGSMGYNTSV